MELDYEQALNYLLDIAHQRKITNAKLCEDICDPSNFSKICSKKRKIPGDLIFKLALKLDVPYDELKLHANFKNPHEYLNIINQFKRFRSDENFREIKKLYEKYYESYVDTTKEAAQLFTWMKGFCEMFVNLNPLYSIDVLKKAILISKPNFSFEALNLEILSEQELDILYDILISHIAHEELTLHPNYQLDYPMSVCLAVIEELSHRKSHQDLSLFPKFCSLIASIYGYFNNIELTHFYTMKGLKYCQLHLQCASIPDLYLQLVTYEKLLNNEEKALDYFYQALYLYHLQNRPPSFYRTIPYFIQNQNLNVDYDKVNRLTPKPLLPLDI